MSDRLQRILATETTPRVLVVGDLILDEYLHGEVTRLSPEAPVPVLQSTRSTYALGGAANVAHNLAVLGCDVELCGVVGDDEAGRRLRELLAGSRIAPVAVVTVKKRPTSHKTRVVARGQHVLRIDREVDAAADDALLQAQGGLDGLDWRYDGIICSDYRKGVLSPKLLGVVMQQAQADGVTVTVDPKGTGYERYRGAAVLTPNIEELEVAAGIEIDGPFASDLGRAAAIVLETTRAEALLVTCGKDGMVLCRTDAEPVHLPARARDVFDITGAGDTVIAALSMALFCGADLESAARLANTAAGVVVGKLGTVPVTRDELAFHALGVAGDRLHPGKVLDDATLVRTMEEARRRGESIVCTNGCFELLHAGHVAYLQAARARGDLLVVGVNSDASVRRLKGEQRPLVPQAERAAVLAALDCVTYVAFFDEDTPARFVERVLPDVLVKGADYALDEIVGRELVEARGGRVEQIPLVPGTSTSGIIERVLARYAVAENDAES